MKIKFNKFERVAGIFVLTAIIGSLAVMGGVAIQKGWFASKIPLHTRIGNADGVHSGTSVQIAGLKAGAVTRVELLSAQEIRVHFYVFETFHKRIRGDSRVQTVRPFIIGEKVLDVSIGSEAEPLIQPEQEVSSIESYDVMDLISGRRLGPLLGSLEGLARNMTLIAEAFSDKRRAEAFISIVDRMEPLILNLNQMSKNVVAFTDTITRKQRLETMMPELVNLAVEMNRMVPAIASATPEMMQHLPQIVRNLGELTEEFKKMTPAITTIAPELPRVSLRAVEALDEAVVLLKAMQKSFLLSGKVKEVREQEKEQNDKSLRTPAGK